MENSTQPGCPNGAGSGEPVAPKSRPVQKQLRRILRCAAGAPLRLAPRMPPEPGVAAVTTYVYDGTWRLLGPRQPAAAGQQDCSAVTAAAGPETTETAGSAQGGAQPYCAVSPIVTFAYQAPARQRLTLHDAEGRQFEAVSSSSPGTNPPDVIRAVSLDRRYRLLASDEVADAVAADWARRVVANSNEKDSAAQKNG